MAHTIVQFSRPTATISANRFLLGVHQEAGRNGLWTTLGKDVDPY